jgi:HEAT repeat protein
MIACAQTLSGGEAVPGGADDGEVRLDDLLGELRSPDERAREEAARALRDLVLGADAEQRWRAALRAALRDPGPTVRYFATQALGRVGDAALLEAARDLATPVRREAVAQVGLLHDAERATWAAGLAAEVDLELAPPEVSREAAVEVLVGALADPELEVREAALLALCAMGAGARAAVPALLDALEDADAVVRTLAAEALGRIGTEARAALPLLLRLEADAAQEAEVRQAAARAIEALTGGRTS